jgi:nondiscriminating aspartyl-tRNA synthetase
MLRTHYSSQINKGLDGEHVTIAGWVEKIRDMGKIKFLVIRDRDGVVQATIKKDDADDRTVDTVASLTRESVVSIHGVVKKNASAPGEVEIIPESVTLLSKAETPLPMETDPKIKSELETRLNYRFLDLRRKEIDAIFKIKDVIHRSFIKYLESEGFILMHVPCVVAASTEGGTNLFPISYFENEAFLSQSPQLYKQMLMASGLDKVIITTPVFRAEEHNTTRHLNEAIQMDIETAFVEDEEDALRYAEGVLQFIIKEVDRHCKPQLEILNKKLEIPKLPVKRMTYDECLELLKEDGIVLKWGEDLTPDAERALCKHHDPIIVTKWPTALRAFYSRPEPGNEKICRAYDILYQGMEILSGAQRIHDHKELVDQMKSRGMNPKNFTFYLDAFRYGMPPHAGWSFGLERLTMLICGAKNVREAVLWPRDRTRITP